MRSISLIGLLLFPLSANAYELSQLESIAREKSFELKEVKDAAEAARYRAYARGSFSPELGLEGNWRYDDEKEKTRDLSYYAYGKWNAFRGFQDYQSWKASKELQNIAETKAERAETRIKMKLRKAYLDVFYLQSLLGLSNEHFKLTETQIQMAKKKISGGLATEADLYDFNIHQTTLKSDEALLQTDFAEKWQALEKMIGVTLDRKEKLQDPGILPVADLSEDEWIARGEKTHDLVLDAKASEQSMFLNRAHALGDLMPSADLALQYGKLFDTDFRESKRDSWMVVGTVSLPIFDGFKRIHEARSKNYELDRAKVQTSQALFEAQNSIRLLLQKIKSLSSRLLLEQERLKQSEKYYEITLSEYRRGVKNSPDLASASDRLFESQNKILELRKNLETAKADLFLTTGSD